MMKKLKIADYIIIIILLLSFGITGYFYPKMPRTIPIHFGVSGQPDNWGPKSMLFLFGGINIALAVLMPLVRKIDPKRNNYDRFEKVWDFFRIFIVFFMAVVQMLLIVTAFDWQRVNTGGVIMSMMGIMFMFIGNYMPKIKHNYSFGIKTPWTLRDSRVWDKTHRMAGPLWAAVGIFTIIFSFTSIWRTEATKALVVFLVAMIVVALLPMIYSYFLFNSLNASGTQGYSQRTDDEE